MKIISKLITTTLDNLFTRSTLIIEGDSLPNKMPMRSIVVTMEDEEVWCAGFKCPCGCCRIIELPIIQEAKPRWDLKINSKNQISLHPSVFLKNGCKSHFWVKNGKVIWCKDD